MAFHDPGFILNLKRTRLIDFVDIKSFYQLMTPSGEYSKYFTMSQILFDPTPLYRKDAVTEVLYGLMAFPSQMMDPVFSPQVIQSCDEILDYIYS